MSIEEIKAAVRARDEFKCRDCGKTNEQHLEETDRQLQVHRSLPGLAYSEFWCVTICLDCHNKRPRKLIDLLCEEPEQSGVYAFCLPLHHTCHVRIYNLLKSEADREHTTVDQVVLRLLESHCNQMPSDYSI